MKPYNRKNRPSWAAPKFDYPSRVDPAPAFMVARSGFGDFAPGSGRRQCVAIAKHGERCRCDAVQGSERCRVHRGMQSIGSRLAKLGYSPAKPERRLRKAIAEMGAREAPEGFPEALLECSPLRRAELFEAWRNRATAPDEWRRARAGLRG